MPTARHNAKPAAADQLDSETFEIGQLSTYVKNPRRGDLVEIAKSLIVNRQYRRVVVNRGTHTGRPNEVLAGNHTFMAAQTLSQPDGAKKLGLEDLWQKYKRTPADYAHIHADVLDVSEAAVRRIVAVDNRSAEKATYDEEILAELLQEIAADADGLLGSGYDEDDLDDLLLSLNSGSDDEDLEGGPDLDRGPVVQYTLIFDDEAQQDRWFVFLRWLRDHQDGDTVAERLTTYLQTLDLGTVGDDED